MNNNEQQTINDETSVSRADFYRIWDRCAFVKNANIRARMVSNLFSAVAAKSILKNLGLEADTSCSIHRIKSILSKWDIAEIYVKGCRISVRTNFSNYKLFVPKKQERYGLFPDLFMFLRVKEDLSSIKLLGFLPLQDLDKSNCDDNNYYIDFEQLKSFDEVKEYFEIEEVQEEIEKLNQERIKIVQYIDGSLENKIEFFNVLSKSKYLKKEMINFELSEKFYSAMVEKEECIKSEIEKDIDNISKLADAFIQSKGEILKISQSQNVESAKQFKLECARANLEKLFKASASDMEMKDINNQSKEEAMDSLLVKSDYSVNDSRLPMESLLKAFRMFVFLILMILFVAGLSCFINYTKYSHNNIFPNLHRHVSDWVINVKKK